MTTHIDPPSSSVVMLYTTWPDREAAQQAAHTLLEAGLIACANILPAGHSVFRWDGEVREEAETIALFKTSRARAGEARDRLAGLHPYDEPCILALPAETSLSAAGFVRWVAGETA